MYYKKSILELIGNTPLLEVENYEKKYNLNAKILTKLEYFNPAGSIKDRAAENMIAEAEKCGQLKAGSTIIEPTSGNTGIGLAAIAAAKGYKAIFTMPETMSIERRKLLKAYGAEIVLTEGKKGMAGAVEKANEILESTENGFIPSQFENPANPAAHYNTTGPEIWRDTDGKVDILVSAFGTGGTVSGIGKYLKEQNKNIKVVAVEPYDSPLVSKGVAGPHKIQGIGANFVPKNLDKTVYDEVMTITTEQAYEAVKDMARLEGILVGVSSGANLYIARVLAEKRENKGKTIVAIMPDGGERYLSTPMFD